MTTGQTLRVRPKITLIGIALGFTIEFFLIPLPQLPPAESVATLFRSADVYYALFFPAVLWWWFAAFLPRRPFRLREQFIAWLAFGFYLCSALRAIGTVAVHILHLERHG
jgi:hypothetical protein